MQIACGLPWEAERGAVFKTPTWWTGQNARLTDLLLRNPLPGTTVARVVVNKLAGRVFEDFSVFMLEKAEEVVVWTQRLNDTGIDFLTFTKNADGTVKDIFVNEAKSVIGEVDATTALNSNNWQRNFQTMLDKIGNSSLSDSVKRDLITRLKGQDFTIRLIGNAEKSTQFTANFISDIKAVTGVQNVTTIILDPLKLVAP